MSAGILDSEATLAAFIQAFLDGALPAADFHHREHVVMAGWHLLRSPAEEALTNVRSAVSRYLAAQGVQSTDTSGYHETLTVFWMRVLDRALRTQPAGLTERERLAALADQFGRRTHLYRDYYSFDVMKSTDARQGWIEPDLRPLE